MKKKKEKESIPIELKLILLGDSSVGKSSIFGRLSGKPFSEETIATVGLEKIVPYLMKKSSFELHNSK